MANGKWQSIYHLAGLNWSTIYQMFQNQFDFSREITILAKCVFLPSRWRYVVISAYCNPSHFFCDPSHLPVIGKVACGAVQYIGGTSLVLVLINFLLQPLITCV